MNSMFMKFGMINCFFWNIGFIQTSSILGEKVIIYEKIKQLIGNQIHIIRLELNIDYIFN